jgi:hypothetical protein
MLRIALILIIGWLLTIEVALFWPAELPDFARSTQLLPGPF